MKSDGSTFIKGFKWLNFGAFFYAGVKHDGWREGGVSRIFAYLGYVGLLFIQLILLAVFILPVSTGLAIYELAPNKEKLKNKFL